MNMSCISIISCSQAYHKLNRIKLRLLSEHFWNTYRVNIRNDVIPIIESKMQFRRTGSDLIPVFFVGGARRWTCTHCKVFIRDDG